MKTANLKHLYEHHANQLLRAGVLGHGIQEDLLLSSARGFARQLVPDGGSFADFFRAALDHHIALLNAVELNLDDAEDCADYHDFLCTVLDWLRVFPGPVLHKSPDPLKLVVGWMGTGYNLGAQVMRRGGPSIIYWGVFRSLRATLAPAGYRNLAELIRQTLVHEIIGHQLAFCTVNGPLLQRDDISRVLELCGIRYLKLIDSPSVEVTGFLEEEDLLRAINRIEYYSSQRDTERYYANVTELIAFATQGKSGMAGVPYEKILSILKRGLLRAEHSLTQPAQDGGTLYQGYSFAEPTFPQYFIENIDGDWRETEALCHQQKWITLEDLWRAWQRSQPALEESPSNVLKPGGKLRLHVATAGYLLQVEQRCFLVCPFGVFTDSGSGRQRHSKLTIQRVTIEGPEPGQKVWETARITNTSTEPTPFKLLPLEVGLPRANPEVEGVA